MPINILKYNISLTYWIVSNTFFCCLFSPFYFFAQDYNLQITCFDQPTVFQTLDLEFPSKIENIAALYPVLENSLTDLQNQGYLAASVDSIYFYENTYLAKLYLGAKHEWLSLGKGNVEEAYLSKIGFRERLYRNQPLQVKKLRQLQENLLQELENNGYPFARIGLDSVQIEQGKVKAQLALEEGIFVTIDSLIIHGKVDISNAYLNNYLGIENGSAYNKSKVLQLKDRIQELPFVEEEKDAKIDFYGSQAILHLYLKPKKASRFDFIVGVLPTTQTVNAETTTDFTITGELKGELYNALGFGERIFAQIEQLRPATPRMDLQVNYPYVLNLPFGLDAQLDFYKQDSVFLNVEFDFGVQYLMSGGNYLKVFWNNQSSSLLSVDENRLLRERALPEQLDLSNRSFGLAYLYQKLDYRFNPRKGWSAFLSGSAGVKTISPNNKILALTNEEFNFQSLYDSLELRSFQYQLQVQLETFLPLGKRGTLKLSNRSSFIFSNQVVFQNEQFRIGGNRLLRGFDEQSIFATKYSLFTLEPRLLLTTNSYFYAFFDYAWLEDRTNRSNRIDRPYSLGAGITLETAVGLFGMSLAVGSQRKSGLDFRSPKVHLGYVSLF
ncbi:MAG: BamA/TamA family outer membrane protein [Bacteroidota bacterium]